jgi:hypothetical protein
MKYVPSRGKITTQARQSNVNTMAKYFTQQKPGRKPNQNSAEQGRQPK